MATKRKKRARRAARQDGPRPFKPRPRKTLITPDLINEICESVRKCNTPEDAAELAGVGRTTLYRWIEFAGRVDEKGKPYPTDQIYRDFRSAIEQAESERRHTLKGYIERAARGTPRKVGDWRAAQALGAITDPDSFVPKLKVHVTTQLDAALNRLEEALAHDPDALELAIAALVGRTGSAAAGEDPKPPAGGNAGTNGEGGRGDEAVHAPPAVGEATPVPKPDEP